MNSSFLTTPEARQRVLADHAVLRGLIVAVTTRGRSALRDEKQRPSVRQGLADLRRELERHLEYEEETWLPLLRTADAWGPVRAARMVEDHSGQRAVLVALTEDACDGVRSIGALVEELEWFVQSLERDMLEEETALLEVETIEEMVVFDQVDG